MKTAEVKALVREVLETLPRPYTEHVIDVFCAIECERPDLIQFQVIASELATDLDATQASRTARLA